MSPTRGGGQAAAEFDSLVPRRSPARSLARAMVIVLALGAAWFSPAVTQPSLRSLESNAALMVELEAGGQLVTVSRLVPRAWPSATLTGVRAVPGAEVAGVWLLPGHELPELSVDPGGAQGPVTLLREGYPDRDIQPGGNLPREFSGGQPLHLVMLWEVTDCARLDASLLPEAQVRTMLGTTRADVLWDVNGPAAFLADLPALCAD